MKTPLVHVSVRPHCSRYIYMVLFQHFGNCDYCLSFWELGNAIPGQVDINMEEK